MHWRDHDHPEAKGVILEAGRQRAHRKLGLALVVAGCVLAFVAIFAIWANRQALNTDNWTNTSSKLLEDDEIRAQLSAYLVDQLYANTNVTQQVSSALPPRAAALAGPIAGGLHEVALRVVDDLLQRPRVQQLWENANRQAHKQLLAVLRGGNNNVSTQNGQVTLNLQSLLQQTQQEIGIGGRIAGKLPPNAAQLVILRSNQLKTAQNVADAVRPLAIALTALALILFAVAIYLARGWRREAFRAAGFALLIAGVAALVARSIAGHAVVESLTATESTKHAVNDAWSIGTSLLDQAAVAAIAYGIFILFAAWLAGPTGSAVATRRGLAPYLREPVYAWTGLTLIILLLLVWGPTPASRQASTAVLLIALLIFGFEMLRRQTAREFPDATLEAAAERRSARLAGIAGRMRGDRKS
jgi:hypothetical protein